MTSFLLASIDQVLARRSSISSLLVLGVSASTLRLAQLWESLVPLLIGLPLAAGLGFTTGSTYLLLSNADLTPDWQQLWLVVAAACGGALALALTLLVLAVPRLQPAAIRHT
jgi:hypothetical protein